MQEKDNHIKKAQALVGDITEDDLRHVDVFSYLAFLISFLRGSDSPA